MRLGQHNFRSVPVFLFSEIGGAEMLRKSLLAVLGFVVMLAVISPSRAHAAVVVGVGVGPVVVAHPYVVVDPRPYVDYGPPPPYAYAPVYAYPGPGYYAGGRWYPRYYAYRRYVGPRRYWRR